MGEKRIGIKYCGGCNPTYERVELIQRIQAAVRRTCILLHHDEPDLDAVLLVCGCARACAREEWDRSHLPTLSVEREEDLDASLSWLRDGFSAVITVE